MTWEGKMVKENTLGEMVATMMGAGRITKLQEPVYTYGQMVEDMKDNG